MILTAGTVLALAAAIAAVDTTAPFVTLGGRSMDAEFADLDGDGRPDLVVAGEWAPNQVLLGDAERGFRRARFPSTVNDSEDIAIADFNGDGLMDLVFAAEDDRRSELFYAIAPGRFDDAVHPFPEATSNAVIVFDADGDGIVDLAYGNAGRNTLLLGNGRGGFRDVSREALPGVVDVTQDLEAGDIDGDGDLDLVLANEDHNRVLRNDGQGRFADIDRDCLPLPHGPEETREADLGDVDGDGDLDLFYANVDFRRPGEGQNRLLLNDGTGCFTGAVGWLPDGSTRSLDVDFVDVDGDGRLDALVANFGGVQVLRNTAEGFRDETEQWLPGAADLGAVDVEVVDLEGRRYVFVANFTGADRLLPLGTHGEATVTTGNDTSAGSSGATP